MEEVSGPLILTQPLRRGSTLAVNRMDGSEWGTLGMHGLPIQAVESSSHVVTKSACGRRHLYGGVVCVSGVTCVLCATQAGLGLCCIPFLALSPSEVKPAACPPLAQGPARSILRALPSCRRDGHEAQGVKQMKLTVPSSNILCQSRGSRCSHSFAEQEGTKYVFKICM